jgi:hypothetical protein
MQYLGPSGSSEYAAEMHEYQQSVTALWLVNASIH